MLHIRNIEELKVEWVELLDQLNTMFDSDMDLQGVIFLIGVQELGHGPREFGKSEKQDLMHIATCKLLSQFGYYELEGSDDQGWQTLETRSETSKNDIGRTGLFVEASSH